MSFIMITTLFGASPLLAIDHLYPATTEDVVLYCT